MTDMLEVLGDLRNITATPDRGCTRLAYTQFEQQAHDYVWDCLRDIPGLRRIEDAAGNTFIVPARAASADEPMVLIGSHLDTVIEGGWLDGALGIAAGVHVLREQGSSKGVDSTVCLVVFRDEEGARFNSGLFGSKVFAGLCQPEDLAATDENGVRVADVVPDPTGCCDYRPPVRASVFLECHIEQGARLIASKKRIGLVTGVVGIRRFELVATGSANHAGTTDMLRRVDALVPVADVVARLPTLVEDMDDAVITCGRLTVKPGVPNVVPGMVSAIVEIRAADESALDALEGRVRNTVEQMRPAVTGARLAHIELRSRAAIPPVATDAEVQNRLAGVLQTRGIPFEALPSMAVHDAQHAALRCSAGMFFIPSLDGTSHNPDENSREADVELAGDVMLAWAEDCVAQCL